MRRTSCTPTASRRRTLSLVTLALATVTACSGSDTPTGTDTQDPTVALTGPAAGNVQGIVTLTATAQDDRGVAGVRFQVDGADVGSEDLEAPYSAVWNTAQASNGAHTIVAIARDQAGNVGASTPVTVTVANGPAPTTGTIQISITTTGNDLDGDGYTLDPGTGAPQTLGVNGSITLADLAPGTHAVMLQGLAQNCTLVGYARRTAAVTAGSTASVNYTVRCAALSSPTEPIVWRTIQQVGATGHTLYTIHGDGSGKSPLILTDHHNPEWSQDRTKIAFSTIRDGNSEIYTMNADGTGEHRLTTLTGHQVDPTWSPDATHIAYEDQTTHDIWVMAADGTNPTNLTAGNGGSAPAWAPSLDSIAFARNGGIWIMAADGSNPHVVTAAGSRPHWSPNGAQLLFYRVINGGEGSYWIANADGSGESLVIHTFSLYDYGASWAPNGRQLVYSSSVGNQDNLWIINTDGTGATNVTNGTDQINDQPSWSR